MNDDQTHDPKNPTALTPIGDGFDNYSDRIEGDEGAQPQGIIRGAMLKFSATAEWERRDGEIIEPGVKLIVTDIVRAVLKWDATDKTKRPEVTVIPPGQPFPDVQLMNDKAPREEWRQGPNGMQGPFQVQQAVVLLDPLSMETYTYTTSTIGGFIAVRELVDKVKTMRRYRGPVSPIVTLGDAPMRTRFGERRRPSIHIVDWVRMGGGEEPAQAVLPAPSPSPTGGAAAVIEAAPIKIEPAAKTITTIDVAKPLPSVKPVSVSEEMGGDAIPF
jgi:hypothetical protein